MSSDDLIPESSLRFSSSYERCVNEVTSRYTKSIETFVTSSNNKATQHQRHEIINIGTSDDLTPLTTRNDRIQEFLFNNCKSKSQISDFFMSLDNEKELKGSKNILLVKFKFISAFCELSPNELKELDQKCSNKAVIISIEFQNGEEIFTYWKSKKDLHFLILKPIKNVKLVDNKKLHEFTVNFLATCMKNGHSGLIKDYVHSPEQVTIEINLLADSRNFNLLMQACEKGSADIVKITLELGMNTNMQGSSVNAQSLAMAGHHYDVIFELIEANLTFPGKLDIKKCPEKIQNIYKTTEELHDSIKDNVVGKVKEILSRNIEKFYFYNILNESAVKAAIMSQSMETYELLLSKKLRFGPHENAEEILQTLEDQNKIIAREIHDRQKQNSPENHINILMANSFICHDDLDPKKKLELVNNAYRTLNSNEFIQIILMVVAASKKFKIIFDFNRESVNVADPTADSYTQGLFYPSGRIYIGAKQLLNLFNKNETLATMAHELCHFAMNLVYRNAAKPYTRNDNQTMQEFKEISKNCREHSKKEFFIDLVYDRYPDEMHHAELIVRVVHLMALYRDKSQKLKEVSESFCRLFEFYKQKIFPELKKALPEIEAREEKEQKKKDYKLFKYKFLLILSGILCSITVVVVFFIVRAFFSPPTYVFNELPELEPEKVKNDKINYKNFTL